MLARIRKAVIAGLGALATGVVGAIVQAGGMPGLTDLIPVVIAAIAVGYAAYRVPNAAPVAATPAAPVKPGA